MCIYSRMLSEHNRYMNENVGQSAEENKTDKIMLNAISRHASMCAATAAVYVDAIIKCAAHMRYNYVTI